MVLNNIKSAKGRGFTIVELLVVIVVIGILAAITIVSYTGITAKANQSKAMSNVQSIGSVVDTMAADGGYYPGTLAAVMAGGTYAKIPSGISVSAATPVSATATTLFKYYWCGGTITTATGARIDYYDQVSGNVASIYFGTGTPCTVAA